MWAHPYLFRGGTVEEISPELVAGLMGVEVYYPTHSQEHPATEGMVPAVWTIVEFNSSQQ